MADLRDGEMAKVVVYGAGVVPEKGVGVTERVASLRLNCSVAQLLRQGQGLPAHTERY